MAQVDIGKIKIVWKGAWNSSTAYTVDDAVSHSGSSYICIQAGTNQNPSSATAYWQVMATAGTNGTNGTDLTSTLGTQGQIVYRDGSGLAALNPGTSGQVLKTQGAGANPIWGTDAGGSVRKVTMFNDATYDISLSSASVSFPITFDFVKAQADSDIFIQGWTPAAYQASHLVGVRMRLQKTTDSSYAAETDNEAYGGQLFVGMYSGANGDGQRGFINWSRRIDTSSETFFNVASTFRVHLGWSSRNGGSERPGERWNPQNTSGRSRQNSTQIWVWELSPTNTAFVT